jgi:hypothetical protein
MIMKEKFDDDFMQKEEFKEQQENQILDNQQLDLQKQQSLGNIQQDAQKTQQVLAPHEQVEKKIGATVPVVKDKVSIPGGEPPMEPEPVQVIEKYEAIEGKADADYDNVLETWEKYRQMGTTTPLDVRIRQLKNVETNASRYCRWKITFFMNKNSVKYKRYLQIEEIKKKAKAKLPELRKNYKTQLDVQQVKTDDRLTRNFNNRFLPVRLLSMIVGATVTGIKSLGRAMFGIQNGSYYRDSDFGNETITYGNMFIESVQSLFVFGDKKKKLSKEEEARRIAQENENNLYYEDIEGTEEVAVRENEDHVAVMTDVYHGLLDDQRALLALYKKGKKSKDKQVRALEDQVREKMQRITSFNETAVVEHRVHTVDARELEEQLDKYRS